MSWIIYVYDVATMSVQLQTQLWTKQATAVKVLGVSAVCYLLRLSRRSTAHWGPNGKCLLFLLKARTWFPPPLLLAPPLTVCSLGLLCCILNFSSQDLRKARLDSTPAISFSLYNLFKDLFPNPISGWDIGGKGFKHGFLLIYLSEIIM